MNDAHYMGLVNALAWAQRWFLPAPLAGFLLLDGSEACARGCIQGQRNTFPPFDEALAAEGVHPLKSGVLYLNWLHFDDLAILDMALARCGRWGIRQVVIEADVDGFLQGPSAQTYFERHGVSLRVLGPSEAGLLANAPFFLSREGLSPYLTLKSAITIDGRVATQSGASQWITSSAAREDVHRERALCQGVIVGTGTVLADDCQLTVRLADYAGPQPTRIVLDRQLKIPIQAKIFDTCQAPTLLFTAEKWSDAELLPLEKRGVIVYKVPEAHGGLQLAACFAQLAKLGFLHCLIECGPTLAASLLAEGWIDRCLFYMAPKLFGGQGAKSVVGELGVEGVDDGPTFEFLDITPVGVDIRIEAKPLRTRRQGVHRID